MLFWKVCCSLGPRKVLEFYYCKSVRERDIGLNLKQEPAKLVIYSLPQFEKVDSLGTQQFSQKVRENGSVRAHFAMITEGCVLNVLTVISFLNTVTVFFACFSLVWNDPIFFQILHVRFSMIQTVTLCVGATRNCS